VSSLHPSHRAVASGLLFCVILGSIEPLHAEVQFGKRLLQLGACGGGAILGAKVGLSIVDKIVQLETVRKNLSPAETEVMTKSFKIGFALAMCGGGVAVAGTTYSKLSKRGKENRERELLAAVADAQPRTYSDPDRPTLRGTLTPQASVVDGDKECRLVDDHLADEGQGDHAMVRFCRPANGGSWKLDAL